MCTPDKVDDRGSAKCLSCWPASRDPRPKARQRRKMLTAIYFLLSPPCHHYLPANLVLGLSNP